MVDVLTHAQRRINMSRIRARDTQPEMILRRGLHRRGLRYLLHRKDLPGKPDLVFPASKVVILRSWLLLAHARLPEVQVASDQGGILAGEDPNESRTGPKCAGGIAGRRVESPDRVGVCAARFRTTVSRRSV